MFRFFRNKEAVKKYLLIFFLGIVSIGMVITLAPIPAGDIGRGDSAVMAEIGGQTITTSELRRVLDSRMRNSSFGYNQRLASALARPLLDDMILGQAVKLQAKKLGIVVSDAEVLRAAQAIPGLYSNGAFIGRDLFERQAGLTLEQFISQLRDSLLEEKMRAVLTDGVQVTPAEVREEFLKRNAKAKIEYALFDPSEFVKKVEVAPQGLEAFFKKDLARYKVPEERRLRYVLIEPDRLRAQVKLSEENLRRYYQQHLSDYRVPDRVKVAHILFKTTGKIPAEVATIEKTAHDVLSQVRSGKDFGELAKKYSEDSTAAQGGEIGWIVRGQTVKEFEDTAFSFTPGQMSELIKTPYGIHILKVLDRQTAHLQTFEEVKEGIRAGLEKQALDAAENALAEDIVRQSKSNRQSLETVARKAELQVKETPLIRYNQVVPDFGKSEAFQSLAFQLRPGDVGSPISVPKGLAIMQVSEVVPEHMPKLEEVRPSVEQDYRADRSKVLAGEKAKEFAAKAKTGDFKQIARGMGLTVKESKDFTQQDFVEGVGPGSQLSAAFTLTPAQTTDALELGGNSLVFRVLSHTPANEAGFSTQRDQIAEQLLGQKRALMFEIYRKELKQQLLRSGELKMNDAGIKQFIASLQGR